MAASEDLINFDVIESQKENIQSLPGGRSAKKLFDVFSPLSPLHPLPTPTDTKTANARARAAFEDEVANIAEADDPLDVYDRYVRWTLDTYPAAQATAASQLHTLLERATRHFLGNPAYKNDARYLRLWLHYIRLFAEAPRETFTYLARHGVGEGLALFYEEYAAWLEGRGRWAQAEEVFKLGMEREALPQSRLIRKFGEFEQRRACLPAGAGGVEDGECPASPALPTVRPALVAKVDPYAAAAAAAADPQAPRQHGGVGGPASKPGRAKMAIFSDADAVAPAVAARPADANGWARIDSLAERKKENVVEPKPWVGETLNAGGKKSGMKMAVFRDPSLVKSHITIHPSQYQVTTNPQNGKKERIAVKLAAIYPTPEEPGSELSFAEVWAARRGVLDKAWEPAESPARQVSPVPDENSVSEVDVVDILAETVSTKLVVHQDVDVVRVDENGAILDHQHQGRPKKKKVVEVNATQMIKVKLDSPSGPKLKKKSATSEPTMTMHTKAATEDIYDIFNQPLKQAEQEEPTMASESDYETDGDYTSGAESTGTTRPIEASENGDEDEEMTDVGAVDVIDADDTSDIKSVSEWSDFSTGKHVPRIGTQVDDEDLIDLPENADSSELIDPVEVGDAVSSPVRSDPAAGVEAEERLTTPIADDFTPPQPRTTFIPIPPEDYVPPSRPYRDPAEVANNRLPFMTPITERTESSLEFTSEKQHLNAKTPSKVYDACVLPRESLEPEPMSSPLLEVVNEARPRPKVAQPLWQKAAAPKPAPKAAALPKGPIIKDMQCNPVEAGIREEILANIQPSLSSYVGFFDHRDEKYEKGAEIRRYAKSLSAVRSGKRRTSSLGVPAVVQFPYHSSSYTIRRELGVGAFAPVYLVENSNPSPEEHDAHDENTPVAVMGRGAFATASTRRSALEALKMETPPTAWEFHMMRLAHARLGPQHRATASLSAALECHLFADETFLVLPHHAHGTLLDVVNLFRSEPSGAMDEPLAVFFAVELLRAVEALHAHGLLHGDLKPDNCLLRLDALSAWAPDHGQLASAWRADGAGGWGARGVVLIDFGRGIDMRNFPRDVQFIADWKMTAQDCPEMREGRPWTWHIDYYGLAGVLHCLLFGRYIETVRVDGAGGGLAAQGGGLGGGRRYRIRESLKRYWQTDIWADAFELLLNPAAAAAEAEEGGRMPCLRGLKGIRERMEGWLEGNCERGVGLKGLMARVEAAASKRK